MDISKGEIDESLPVALEEAESSVRATENLSTQQTTSMAAPLPDFAQLSRKEKRKILKKLRRKVIRQQAAEEENLEKIASAEDTGQLDEELEAEYFAKEKADHDERERLWIERERKAMEDFQRQQEERKKVEDNTKHEDQEEDWRYVESDGPAEIIWQGNEIIVRKRRVKVPADTSSAQAVKDENQPTSNPLPPQSAAFAAHKYPQTTDVKEHAPMFGTEQDKTHCPFHIKTGVCRFGVRCSRVHVYPDQSFTLLMRNMYTGPGLICENDEGLEHSDEEVAQHYEEFYEDVHSEFLQFGELVNFKVSKNASSHLRGNVYVHYKTEACAQAAYSALNGRFYAGKQITCEFVGVTRWRIALCGEYMKGHHRPCSHGTACNFLHCFQNPGGEYDWADWDCTPPRYWVVKIAKLFGYEKDLEYCEDDNNEDAQRRQRQRDSPRRRESRQRKRRSRDSLHHEDSVDDFEHASRHKRLRSRSDYYRSESDAEESPSNHRRHSSRDIHSSSVPKEVNGRGRSSDKDPFCRSVDEEAVRRDHHRFEGRGQKRRSTMDSHDLNEERVDGVTPRDRRSKSRDGSYSRHHTSRHVKQDGRHGHSKRSSPARDIDDCDYQQSLDVVSWIGRHRSSSSELESRDRSGSDSEDGAKKRRHRKDSALGSKVDHKSRNRRTIYRDTDANHERYRRRKSGGGHHRSKRKVESVGNETYPTESKTFDEDDRWTGNYDS